MAHNRGFEISERDWLETKLELYALRWSSANRGESIYFSFPDGKTIVCDIYSERADAHLSRAIAREEQLKVYRDWVSAIRNHVESVVNSLPLFMRDFDIVKNLQVRIFAPYGMGSTNVCNFANGLLLWAAEP
jgi:hypothetical protein